MKNSQNRFDQIHPLLLRQTGLSAKAKLSESHGCILIVTEKVEYKNAHFDLQERTSQEIL